VNVSVPTYSVAADSGFRGLTARARLFQLLFFVGYRDFLPAPVLSLSAYRSRRIKHCNLNLSLMA
jgi:hypothetical protein